MKVERSEDEDSEKKRSETYRYRLGSDRPPLTSSDQRARWISARNKSMKSKTTLILSVSLDRGWRCFRFGSSLFEISLCTLSLTRCSPRNSNG